MAAPETGAGAAGSEFAGVVAVVTGGGSGIGLATARLLAARGARVACLDLDPSAVAAPLLGIACDVGDDGSVRRAIDEAARALGGIDVLVNNAGVGAIGELPAHDDAEWQRVFGINVLGAARATRAALPWLRRSACAAIVNNASSLAFVGLPDRALYAATKGALVAMTRALAAEFVVDRIRVNCVTPGVVDTPWQQRAIAAAADPDALRRRLRLLQPTRTLVTPEQVAHAIAYLASPASGSTTGVDLPVDGGMQALHLSAGARLDG